MTARHTQPSSRGRSPHLDSADERARTAHLAEGAEGLDEACGWLGYEAAHVPALYALMREQAGAEASLAR